MGFDTATKGKCPAERYYYVAMRAPGKDVSSIVRRNEIWVQQNLGAQLEADSLRRLRTLTGSKTERFCTMGGASLPTCMVRGAAGSIAATALFSPAGQLLGLVDSDSQDTVVSSVLVTKPPLGWKPGDQSPSKWKCVCLINEAVPAEFDAASAALLPKMQLLNRWQTYDSLKGMWTPLRASLLDIAPFNACAITALKAVVGSPPSIKVVRCTLNGPESIALSSVAMRGGNEGTTADLPVECRCLFSFTASQRAVAERLAQKRGSKGRVHKKRCLGTKRRRSSIGPVTQTLVAAEMAVKRIAAADPTCSISTPTRNKILAALLGTGVEQS